MKPTTNSSIPDDPKALADSYMLSTLRRAASGALKPIEAETCLRVVEAYRIWTEAHQKNETLERAAQIIELAKELRERGAATDKRIAELRELIAAASTSRRKTTARAR